jgi:outer membrane protein W
MKKTMILTVLTIITFTVKSFAQSEGYTPWQLNFTGGYAAASGKGTKGGIAIHFEPQYHINDNFSAGIRFGGALTAKFTLNAAGDEVGDASVAAVASYLATANYYFQKEPGAIFRPFAGIGVGFANAAGASTDNAAVDPNFAEDYASKGGFAGMARAGFDVSHFRFNLEYCVNPKTGRINNNYFGVTLGFYFGGGAQK